MKKLLTAALFTVGMLSLSTPAFADEVKKDNCDIIFFAETVYGDKEVKLCREGNTITYELKKKNSSDSIVKVVKDKDAFYVDRRRGVYVDGKKGAIDRIYIEDGKKWYALTAFGDKATIWGYESKGITKEKRSIALLSLYYSTALKIDTLIFNESLLSDFIDFTDFNQLGV